MSQHDMIQVNQTEIKDLVQAFVDAPEIAAEEMAAATVEAQMLFEREVKERTPVGISGGGGLRGSITSPAAEVNARGVTGIVGTSLMHAVPVELGTKPHMPPVQPLADWAQHKLGVDAKDAKRVGFLIARKISVKGTKGVHMFKEAQAATQPQITQIFEDGIARIATRIGGAS